MTEHIDISFYIVDYYSGFQLIWHSHYGYVTVSQSTCIAKIDSSAVSVKIHYIFWLMHSTRAFTSLETILHVNHFTHIFLVQGGMVTKQCVAQILFFHGDTDKLFFLCPI